MIETISLHKILTVMSKFLSLLHKIRNYENFDTYITDNKRISSGVILFTSDISSWYIKLQWNIQMDL